MGTSWVRWGNQFAIACRRIDAARSTWIYFADAKLVDTAGAIWWRLVNFATTRWLDDASSGELLEFFWEFEFRWLDDIARFQLFIWWVNAANEKRGELNKKTFPGNSRGTNDL